MRYDVDDLIAVEGYMVDCTNLKFVRKSDPPIVKHDLSYPHLVVIVNPSHI